MARLITIALLTLFLVLQTTTVRSWEDRTEVSFEGWEGHEQVAEVREIYRDFNLVLVPSEGGLWEAGEIRSIRKGAEAMPGEVWGALRAARGRPVFIERSGETCLLGMGRYTRACPSFDRDKETFYLYEMPPVQGEGPIESLAILTVEEQRDVQRRRAVVHLAMSLLDEERGWSQRSAWRSINGWPSGRGDALNIDGWGYSHYLGTRSAHLDLVTFAEEYFVRPEDLLLENRLLEEESAPRLGRLDPNKTVACQQFTKSRVLRQSIGEVAAGWHEPERRLPGHDEGAALCPEFETWANEKNLAGVDLLLAAATSRPQSLYGHLLMHVRYRSDGTVASEGFEPVYQFGAVTDSDVHPVDYFGRGLIGGFSSVIEYNTFRGIDRLILQFEQRTLRRYALNLSETQSRQVLERIWEAERRIIYPYAFLTKNCASFLLDLLEPALDLEMPNRRRRIMAPTDVLDYLANLDNGDEGGLLTKRPDDLLSTRERAQDAVLTRRALLDGLARANHPSRDTARELRRWAEELDSPEPEVRNAAYDKLGPMLMEVIDDAPETRDTVIDFLYYSVRIERYFMEVAYYARRQVYASAHLEPFQMSADEQLELRRRLHGKEDLSERAAARNHWATAADERLRNAARRPFTPEEELVIAREGRTRKVYLALLDVQATIIDAYYPDWDGVAFLEGKARQFEGDISERDRLSKLPSGKSRVVVGMSGDVSNPERLEGVQTNFELSYSFIYDRLGELRERGFRGDLEARNFALDLKIPLGPDAHRNIAAEGVLFRYMTVEQKAGPIKRSWRDGFGWGVDVRGRHDGRRELYFGGELTGSLLYPLLVGRHTVNHLVAGVGLQARYDIAPTNHVLGGVQGKILGQVHLYGHYANVLRMELRTAQLAGYPVAWHQDYVGHLSTEHALFALGQYQLIISPQLEVFSTTLDYGAEDEGERFIRWQGALRVELPF